jgi:hypothetical protein
MTELGREADSLKGDLPTWTQIVTQFLICFLDKVIALSEPCFLSHSWGQKFHSVV